MVGAFAADVQSASLLTPFGIYKPDRLKKLFGKVPRQSAISWMMALGNMSKRTTHNWKYEFFEEGQWYNASAVIASAGANGTTATNVDIVIAAADHTNSGKNSYARVNDTVVFSDEKTGMIIAIDKTTDSAHIYTIQGYDGTDINPAATATETFVIFSTAHSEDSSAPDTRVPEVTREENTIQTFRESFKVTDEEEKTQTWFEVDGKPYMYVKGTMEAAERFEQQIESACLVGQSFTGMTDPNTGYDVKTTEGLIPTIRSRGTTVTYDKGTLTPTLDNFETIILAIEANYGPKDYIVGQGLDLDLKMNRMLVDFATGNTGQINFSPMGGREQALSLNFKWLNYSGRQFWFQRWDILSHEDSFGAAGLGYRKMGMYIPLGKTKNPSTQNGTKNFEDYMQMVYVPPSGSSSEVRGTYKIWETGANAMSGATNDKLRREIHHAAYCGFEMRNKEKFLIFEPAP